jgi:hypothetical protein
VPEENITKSFVMLCSLVDQAPNDVIDGAVRGRSTADPQSDPQQEIHKQIHTGNPVSGVWKSSSLSRARYNIAANHGKSQVVNGW